MTKTTFRIAKMDCPAEEQIVRFSLEDLAGVEALKFDLATRKLEVFHRKDPGLIYQKLDSLALDTVMIDSAESEIIPAKDYGTERRILVTVLLINFGFFLLEIVTGLIGGSMGLVADGLDMLADCLVFGLSLLVVGSTVAKKKKVATASGYFQLALALFGLIEVIRRFWGFGEVPEYQLMIVISSLALIGNGVSIFILQKARREEAHMQASYIFLSNDVIINFGVILAGILVFIIASKLPDLIIGTLIFLVVARGAFKILKLGADKT